MKYLFLALALGACSMFQGKEDEATPVTRESFNPCPFMVDGVNHPNCPKSGAAKGGICLPSGELHSVPEKCDKVK